MEFSEKSYFSFPALPNNFIYFLIDGDEVVYIGKTTQGVFRPLSHKDKKYDKIEIVLVPNGTLDQKEGEYINKYLPKYNLLISGYVSFLKARDLLRKRTGIRNLTVWDVKWAIKKSGVNATTLNSISYISPDDLLIIQKTIQEEQDERG